MVMQFKSYMLHCLFIPKIIFLTDSGFEAEERYKKQNTNRILSFKSV